MLLLQLSHLCSQSKVLVLFFGHYPWHYAFDFLLGMGNILYWLSLLYLHILSVSLLASPMRVGILMAVFLPPASESRIVTDTQWAISKNGCIWKKGRYKMRKMWERFAKLSVNICSSKINTMWQDKKRTCKSRIRLWNTNISLRMWKLDPILREKNTVYL